MAMWLRIALAIVLLASSPAHAVELSVMAEDAAEPFAGPGGSGYADDVVLAAFRAAGVTAKLDVVPYARCKTSVEEGKVAACFGMSWQEAMTGKIAFSNAPLFQVYADLVLRGKPARDPAPDLAPGAIIGVINDYEYPAGVYKLRDRGLVLQPGPNDYANLNMLARGRLDGAIVMTNDLQPVARKAAAAGVDGDIRYGYRYGVQKAYVGFSLRHPRGQWAKDKFDAGYAEILRNGTLAAIRRKWTARLQ